MEVKFSKHLVNKKKQLNNNETEIELKLYYCN